IRTVRRRIEAFASDHGMKVATMGVALDRALDPGLEFLKRFGDFDEVSVGRSWMNSGAVSYFWRDVAGPDAIPQLIVVRRTVDVAENSLTVSEDQLVGRAVGA